jgi:hypothetical protein
MTQDVSKKTKAAYKTANTDPATINANPVLATFLRAAAFWVEIGRTGPVLDVATAPELTELSFV